MMMQQHHDQQHQEPQQQSQWDMQDDDDCPRNEEMKPTKVFVQDDHDDDTELLSSFASMMMSSISTFTDPIMMHSSVSSLPHAVPIKTNTIQSSHMNPSSLLKTKKSPKDYDNVDLSLYKLHKNEYECLGYVQFQVYVSCFNEIPTELALISQKSILYVQTEYYDIDPTSSVESPHKDHHDDTVWRTLNAAFSHPLLVEILETVVIPIAIIPKKHGCTDDMQQSVPSHTHLGLRISNIGFIDMNGRNVVPPISFTRPQPQGPMIVKSILGAIISVLQSNQQTIPKYVLGLLDDTYLMNDFVSSTTLERRSWFGFIHPTSISDLESLKSVDGISNIQNGTFANHNDEYHIMEVSYNSKRTSFSTIVKCMLTKLPNSTHQMIIYCQSNDERMAARLEIIKLSNANDTTKTYLRQCAIVHIDNHEVFVPSAMDIYSNLRQTPIRFVPMTEYQTRYMNQLVSSGQAMDMTTIDLFSPRQMSILKYASTNQVAAQDVIGYPIFDAWMFIVDKQANPVSSIHSKIDTNRKVGASSSNISFEPEVYNI